MDSTNSFRILDLSPGIDSDDIQCTIRNADLSMGEHYEALSYVWGDRVHLRPITVSHSTIQITEGLYSALRRFRHKKNTRSLWIDQLCIDQSNPRDKSRQVSMMRRIYKGCSRCLIWLGEVPDAISIRDASAALDFISLSAQHPSAHVPSSLSTHEQRIGARNALETLTLNGNSWWSRIWTVQEAVLPPCALVTWGALHIPWSTISDAAVKICLLSLNDNGVLPRIVGNVFMDSLDDFTAPVRGLEIAREGENPLDLLQRWRYRDATDTRDKVFALMGLFPSMPLPHIQSCNYDVSACALYTTATIDLLHLEQGLRPLIGQRLGTDSDINLPTWVIDLSQTPSSNTTDWWWNHSHRYHCFAASAGMLPFQCTPLHKSLAISLSGVLVDRIERTGHPLPAETSQAVLSTQIRDTLLTWKKLIAESRTYQDGLKNYPNGDSLQIAFWKTILGDFLMDEFPTRKADNNDCQLLETTYQTGKFPRGFLLSMARFLVGQSFFVTENGYIGIGPRIAAPGDEVWVLSGGNVPFVLRRKSLSGDHEAQLEGENRAKALTLQGNAFVYGLMNGEALSLMSGCQDTIHLY